MDIDSDMTVGSVQPLVGRRIRDRVLSANLIGDAQRRGTYPVE
jgi:hypothetical protein